MSKRFDSQPDRYSFSDPTPVAYKCTKEEFIADFCQKVGIARMNFDDSHSISPCNCGKSECKGWLITGKSK
jgi:hypothetical protein